MNVPDRVLAKVIEEWGWIPGTKLENQVAFILAKYKAPPCVQQYRPGRRLRLDFAWPQVGIALEADGWHHRSPPGAAKDRQRDSWLRSQGWLVFRVDDEHGEATLNHQVLRVVRLVRVELSDPLEDWANVLRYSKWPAWKP